MDDSTRRLLTRAPQACEPCRRKKSKCPGERPVCSHCARLEQHCTYAPRPIRPAISPMQSLRRNSTSDPSRPSDQVTVDRLNMLEAQMAEMRRSLRERPSDPSPLPSIEIPRPQTGHLDRLEDPRAAYRLPHGDVLKMYAQLYLKYCNYQPLPLFSNNLATEITLYDPELLLVIMALALRFDTNSPSPGGSEQLRKFDEYKTTATDWILRRVARGPVELSTIQALCLLSLAEFNHGNTPQASAYSSLAMDLALSAGLSSEDPRAKSHFQHDERSRCYWSIVLLKNLYGNHTGTVSLIRDDKTPNIPQSPRAPATISSQMTDAALEQPDHSNQSNEPSDLGIVAYVIELSEIWQKAARYAHRRGKAGGEPPWSTQSDYSQITAELMLSETHLPYKYRFRPARFGDQDPLQLENHRDFWASWLLLQTLYHTVLCLLNHPLLLSLRLRSFRVTMIPEVFLQHTADLTETHIEWILHIVDLCEQKNFELFNPFHAHAVAIVATIYLQQSFSEDSTVRSTNQECFRKCVSFVRRLGRYWPYIEQLAVKIERFEQVVSNSYRDSASPRFPDSRVSIDLGLFWEIIESSFVGELPRSVDSYFGASLTSYRELLQPEEVVRAHLLPAPTRLRMDVSHLIESSEPTASHQLPAIAPDTRYLGPNPTSPLDEDAWIPAHNYFALGEDLVANLDDWWFPRQSA